MASNGNRSRFGDLIKKIAWFRRKRKSKVDDIPITVAKVLAAIPGMVYDDFIQEEDLSQQEMNNDETKLIQENADNSELGLIDEEELNRRRKRIRIIGIKSVFKKKNTKLKVISREDYLQKKAIVNSIDVDVLREQQAEFFNPGGNDNPVEPEVSEEELEQDKRTKELEKQIINIIKKKLIKANSKLEILYSELYLLSEVNGKSKVLSECEEELKQVKKMLEQVDKLKEQYDYLRDNHDFEYLLEIEDRALVDKIIELKSNFDKNKVKAVVADYKLLDVYKCLYLKIDDLKDKTVKFEDEKKKEEEELKKRDIDFKKLKSDVGVVDRVKRDYESFVRSQKEIIDDLNSKIGKISSHEETYYRLNGMNQLFKNTFKYLGLLMLNPLRGLIPSIAVNTIATRNMIKTLYNQVSITKETRVVFDATDYERTISGVVDDLDFTDRMIDQSLYDISKLKQKYRKEFQKYHNDFLEYRQVIAKINSIENQIIGNKVKIEMMKQRALEQKKSNQKTLRLVDKYNQNRENTM